jgi:hypothetical protein
MHRWGRDINVAFGSKAESLNASICFPLFTQQRTFLRSAALRQKRPFALKHETSRMLEFVLRRGFAPKIMTSVAEASVSISRLQCAVNYATLLRFNLKHFMTL